jgi:hypothetical protein
LPSVGAEETTNTVQGVSLEERKVLVEEGRLELERQKARREARQGWVARGGVLVPVFAAVIAAIVSLHAAREADRKDFQLKAADIAFANDNPIGTRNRARALAALFPERLKGFAEGFNPASFQAPPNSTESKKELLHLMADHPASSAEILAAWRSLFPADKWAKGLKPLAHSSRGDP